MATKFTVDVLIKGSTNMASVAAGFKKSTDKINASITTVTKAANAQKKAIQAGAGAVDRLSRSLGIGLVAAFAAVAHAGNTFEVAVADLSALTGIVGKELDILAEEALRMSKTFGVGGAKVAETMKLVASAKSELIGVPGAIEKVTEAALVLSKASRVDVTTSTKVLTTALNQFNLGAEEATRVINVLAVGSKLGASEIADTGQAILRAGVASRVAGVSFEETQAALQVLAKGGLKGVIAGTQYKTMLLRMMQSSENLNPKIVGLSKAFENLAQANLTGADFAQLFGLEAMTAGIILTEQVPLLRKWTKEFTGTNIAYEQAKVNMATLWEHTKRLGTAIQFYLIKAFNKMSPTLIKVTQSFTDFINLLANPPNKATAVAIKVLGVALATAAGSFSLLLTQFQIFRFINWWSVVGPGIASMNAFAASILTVPLKALIPGIAKLAITMGSTLVAGVGAATVAVKAFTIALLANPVTWIVVAVAALIGLMYVMVKKWDDWGAALAAITGPFGFLISLVMQFKKHWSDITEAFKSGGIKKGILAIGKVLVSAILHPLSELLGLIGKIPGLGAAGELAERIKSREAALWDESDSPSLTDQSAASINVIPIPSTKQQLDVNMKIDAEGRPSVESFDTNAPKDLTFNLDLGFTNAATGY
jgi:TP901 family phage tail tape measure protein